MRKIRILFALALLFSLLGYSEAAQKKMMKAKDLPEDKQIMLAMSAAPPHISKDATIMVFSADGKLTEARKGTNGFTCIPDVDDQEMPDPMCADEAAMKWANDFMKKASKPSNSVPGIAYMGKGGWHWERDGKVIMNPEEPGAKRVKEPPHWMIFWPFDPAKSGLPSFPGRFGTYIMYEDTPYAHLMIYQNPNKLGTTGMMKRPGLIKKIRKEIKEETKELHEKLEKH